MSESVSDATELQKKVPNYFKVTYRVQGQDLLDEGQDKHKIYFLILFHNTYSIF